MIARGHKSSLHGEVLIPGSKSHMIRSLYFAALARGRSIIRNPVRSQDSLSAAGVIRALGVKVDMSRDGYWIIDGGDLHLPEDVIDVGNSGTSMNLGSALLASLGGWSAVTGDEQIRRRPVQPVLDALVQLGAEGFSLRDNGSAPFVIRGPVKGGHTVVDGLISQYASSALIAASLAERDSEIRVKKPNEVPYIEMTVQWMRSLGVDVDMEDQYRRFSVPAGQVYTPFDRPVPADFSSGAFILIGAAVTDSEVVLQGLDTTDVQGDKVLIDILMDMGAEIEVRDHGCGGITVRGGRTLRGRTIDCSVTPDSIPILSVLGCYAEGETRLVNIESSRLKETDRPLLMAKELSRMGADIELTEKELIVRHSRLSGGAVDGYGDHRIAMALCIAGFISRGETVVNSVESASVSYPGFNDSLRSLGADISFEAGSPGAL